MQVDQQMEQNPDGHQQGVKRPEPQLTELLITGIVEEINEDVDEVLVSNNAIEAVSARADKGS